MNNLFQALHQIAPKLNQLQEDPHARVRHEWMSGGLVWSDELPPWESLEPCECHCLRPIWRYRSSLIMGSPEEQYRPVWEQAQLLFPQWPGFLPHRQQPIWRDFFIEQEAKVCRDWEAIDTKYEGNMPETTGKSATR